MIRRFAPLAGALALSLTLFIGCSDSGISPSETSPSSVSGTTDPYSYFKQDPAVLTDYSEMFTASEVLDASVMTPPGRDSVDRGRDSIHHNPPPPPPGGDTTRRGGDTTHHNPPPPPPPPPGGDSTHHGDTTHHPLPPNRGANFGHLIPGSLGDIVRRLNLTAAQDSAVRHCFIDYRDCGATAARSYADQRRALADSMRGALENIRTQVQAGTITKAQARTMIDAINAAYRPQVDALGASYRSAMDTCKTAFEACVRAQLTAEQAAIWDRLIHG
jgi:hypothetical protein